jgi:hypothetical protein
MPNQSESSQIPGGRPARGVPQMLDSRHEIADRRECLAILYFQRGRDVWGFRHPGNYLATIPIVKIGMSRQIQ